MGETRGFPTIADMHAYLSSLIDDGLGDHTVQVLIVPDATLQAIARASGARPDDKPALMIDWIASKRRMPVTIVSTDRLSP